VRAYEKTGKPEARDDEFWQLAKHNWPGRVRIGLLGESMSFTSAKTAPVMSGGARTYGTCVAYRWHCYLIALSLFDLLSLLLDFLGILVVQIR
jgi:hypothetical protein